MSNLSDKDIAHLMVAAFPEAEVETLDKEVVQLTQCTKGSHFQALVDLISANRDSGNFFIKVSDKDASIVDEVKKLHDVDKHPADGFSVVAFSFNGSDPGELEKTLVSVASKRASERVVSSSLQLKDDLSLWDKIPKMAGKVANKKDDVIMVHKLDVEQVNKSLQSITRPSPEVTPW